jgi:ParB-like chromosome segregation protein Spo0J
MTESSDLPGDIVQRNSQAEAIFDNWRLAYRLDPSFPIEKIEDGATQQVRDQANRANRQYVEEYFQQHEAGAVFPPIVLRDTNFSLIDGNTRRAMWIKAKRPTVPVYLVSLPSADLARALGAQLNQIAGVRLTPDESARQALAMMEEGTFDDQQIARIVGRSRTQITRWRQEREFTARAERCGVSDMAKRVPDAQRRILSKVVQVKPFTELTRLAGSRKVQNSDLNALVDKVLAAESEEAALDAVTIAGAEMHPIGPDGRAVASNPKAKRMRMVLPQVLNLAPAEEFYEPEKAVADRAMWLQIKIAAESALAMYERYDAPGSAA